MRLLHGIHESDAICSSKSNLRWKGSTSTSQLAEETGEKGYLLFPGIISSSFFCIILFLVQFKFGGSRD
ncbi:hypothetical protein L6164_007473 [Bauhinia variegata]|uniref:Uncharacterized protein n=1 Tax=Bauhinia variegata TaxID=167791 RepID=A0ACB9PDI9_BAUVA|nr:hypothetical protein L6164_007473 [Bauhinia variegata]